MVATSESTCPSVSVLVPVYNVERYLDDCLESLAHQQGISFEVICIDDGSTDQSGSILDVRAQSDSRFRVLHRENAGYGAAMNAGLAEAQGEYIAILESDDCMEPGALAALYNAAVTTHADVVKGNFWLWWSAGTDRKELFEVVDEQQCKGAFYPVDDVALFFRKPSIWSALYRRSFLSENQISFLETPGASYQDAGFSFKLWASNPRVCCIEQPIIAYRQDNEASSVKSAAKARCVCDEYDSMDTFIEKRNLFNQAQLYGILARMRLDSYLWNLDRLARPLWDDFVACASQEFKRDASSRRIDWQLFEPGAAWDVRCLMQNPTRFIRVREQLHGASRGKALLTRLIYGGPLLVLRMLHHRYFGRSVRRTDERGARL